MKLTSRQTVNSFLLQKFYTATRRGKAADIFKHIKLPQFAKKYLVWQAICTCSLKSNIYIATGTVNQEIYVSECLQKRPLPFLKRHNCSVLFWPDLASCHYGKKAMEWYAANNVQVVPKDKKINFNFNMKRYIAITF